MTKRKARKVQILVLGSSAAHAVRLAGAEPVVVGFTDARALEVIEQKNIDGLLLTGGGDVNPKLYGQQRSKEVYGVSDARDELEWLALEVATEREIPVLGICRGSQILNVFNGGTLHQHIPALRETHAYHGGGHDHRIKTAEGSRIAKAVGEGTEPWVVSIHHQAVAQVAPEFVATAWGLDGTVEAIESIEGWRMGVQFHPEMATERLPMRRIVEAFVAAAAKNAGLPAPKPLPALAGRPAKPSKIQKAPRPKKQTVTAYTKNAWGDRFKPEVVTRWRCFNCHGMDFDERTDFIDHMLFMHDVDVLEEHHKAEAKS